MLVVHRAERADLLAEMLGDLLAAPLDDPMATEIVSVPTRGVERWLTQRLAGRLGRRDGHADGVCANVAFPFPGTLVRHVLAEVAGEDPDSSPWTPERLAWPLLELVGAHLDEPWLAPLADHLRTDAGDDDRRLSTARHLADLYDRYGVHRPEILLDWARGGDGGISSTARWQAELWRRLRDRLGVPSPAEQAREQDERLRRGGTDLALPARVSLFGLTRLPARYLETLSALAAVRDVHLFLLHPSPALWSSLAGRATPPGGLPRRLDPGERLAAHPLLASWGRDAREMQLVLGRLAAADEHRDLAGTPRTLLGRIQHDIRANLAPPGPPLPGERDRRHVLDPADESLQLHACHGRARQVEVVRDAVLQLFAAQPDLEPRDVILLCPDVEAFAPLVDAAFASAADGGETPDRRPASLPAVPVRVADRSMRQSNPLLELATRLLQLAAARVTASDVLDLAGRAPVRRRFGLGEDELRRLEQWVVASGVRWGLDAAHRRPYKLDTVAANTWAAGLDRLALGAAMAEEGGRCFGGVLPLDDVSPGDLPLVGHLAELVERLRDALDALCGPQPIATWCSALADAVDLLGDTSDADSWQRGQLGRLLAGVVDEASGPGGPSTVPLSRADVAELLGERLQGQPTRANFRSGEITLCTLVPMRAVPHRVVCLLGIDDGAFPRSAARDGDDLLLAEPLVGERDAASEERQLLLDALLAATEHLVVAYSGQDERTNAERPPAVPVGELLDTIDRTAVAGDGSPATRSVLLHHPLHPFDARNFAVGALRAGRPFGFDPTSFGGARALSGRRADPPRFLPAPLAPLDCSTIELADLEAFLRHPVGAFLRTRLGVVAADAGSPVEDALPIELDALATWAVGDRLLAARTGGLDLAAAVGAERARGALPPGALADAVLEPVVAVVEAIAAASEVAGPGAVQPVDVVLASGTRILGAVGDLHGDVLCRTGYSRLGPADRLVAWLHLLAVGASAPERAISARTVGRLRSSVTDTTAQVSIATIAPLGASPAERAARARDGLEVLADLYRRGTCEPLPLFPKTSLAWAEAARLGGDPVRAARDAWRSGWHVAGEDADRRHQEVYGGVVELEALLAERPRPDEHGTGWVADEGSRVGRLARRLWDGLLACERVEDR